MDKGSLPVAIAKRMRTGNVTINSKSHFSIGSPFGGCQHRAEDLLLCHLRIGVDIVGSPGLRRR
jgi:hypothetical protein